MNLINYQDARPIYEQIAEGYKTLILKGVLADGDQMPSVRSLAMELSTNPNTVQKAYTELERQGYIYTVKGKGNYVNGDRSLMINKMEEMACRIREILDEAADLGIDRRELLRSAGIRETKTEEMSRSDLAGKEGGLL